MSDVDSTRPRGTTPEPQGPQDPWTIPPAPTEVFAAPAFAPLADPAAEPVPPPQHYVPPVSYPSAQPYAVGQGHPPQGHPQPSYPQQGYPTQGYPQPSYPQPSYPPQTYPSQGYPAPSGTAYPPPSGTAYPSPGGYAYPGMGYPAPAAAHVAPRNTSAAILLGVAILAILATGIIGPPSGVMAVLSMKHNTTDPARAARLATRGWIVFAINAVIGMFAIVALFWWLANNR